MRVNLHSWNQPRKITPPKKRVEYKVTVYLIYQFCYFNLYFEKVFYLPFPPYHGLTLTNSKWDTFTLTPDSTISFNVNTEEFTVKLTTDYSKSIFINVSETISRQIKSQLAGGWIKSPGTIDDHIIDSLLKSEQERSDFMASLRRKGMDLS